MSEVVSRSPLRGDLPVRVTESGLFLPEPEPDKGFPIVVGITDVPALQFNFVGPSEQDFADIRDAIADAQMLDEGGEPCPLLYFVEPQYGYDFCLTVKGLRHIVAVVRGFATKVDPAARMPAPRPLVIPVDGSRAARRHPLS
jgi:hypothetical protein